MERTWESFCERHSLSRAVVTRLTGGGNNRVFLVQTGARRAVLKVYFHGPDDRRDRFGAERAFYQYTWDCGIRRIPEPIGWDAQHQLGLIEFVEGRKLSDGEIDWAKLENALQFIFELNRHRRGQAARGLPVASEACFRMAEHLECVERRLGRLEKLEGTSPVDEAARGFVSEELAPAWASIRSWAANRLPEWNSAPPTSPWRCLSPSDFGFHNAIERGGGLVFLDFEYAGWDETTKLACDFFCQPQRLVPAEFWARFVEAVRDGLDLGKPFERAAAVLRPVYYLKWCCILLNEFARTDRARRDFAAGQPVTDERKKSQLDKARRWLAKGLELWRAQV